MTSRFLHNISFVGVMALTAAISLPVQASEPTTQTFTSAGKSIHIESFLSTAPGTHPAVLFLYGSDGMAILPLSYNAIGDTFASHGYNFYIVHYFDSTGTVTGTPMNNFKYFQPWVQTVSDATTWVASQPGVDPHRVGVMGMSLGAFLAVAAGEADPRLKAVSEWYGGLTKSTASRMPPTMILHGAKDKIVPVAKAYQLQSVLQQLAAPNGIQIYPNDGHGFSYPDAVDALERTLSFFGQYLAAN